MLFCFPAFPTLCYKIILTAPLSGSHCNIIITIAKCRFSLRLHLLIKHVDHDMVSTGSDVQQWAYTCPHAMPGLRIE